MKSFSLSVYEVSINELLKLQQSLISSLFVLHLIRLLILVYLNPTFTNQIFV